MRRIISNISHGTEWPVTKVITILGQEKKILVLVIRRVDFDAHKKKIAGRKI